MSRVKDFLAFVVILAVWPAPIVVGIIVADEGQLAPGIGLIVFGITAAIIIERHGRRGPRRGGTRGSGSDGFAGPYAGGEGDGGGGGGDGGGGGGGGGDGGGGGGGG